MADPTITAPPPPTPMDELRRLIRGYQITQALYVTVKLGLPDLLAQGPRSAAELAAATKADESGVDRLLRGLASIGVFVQTADGRFDLTPMSRLLLTDATGSQREFALLTGEWRWPMWSDLLYSVQTGQPAHDHVYGMEAYAYLDAHPDLGRMFHGGLIGTPRAQSSALVVSSYDFSGIGTLVDVGGGAGDLLAGILKAHPQMRGVLFDLPYSIGVARRTMELEGVADRCELIGGSFFEDIPARGDVFMLRAVMHNWDDDHCTKILQNVGRATKPGGRLLLVDRVTDAPGGPEGAGGTMIDVEMLVVGSGRERTEAEFRQLLTAAGFQLAKIHPTPSSFHIVEAVRK